MVNFLLTMDGLNCCKGQQEFRHMQDIEQAIRERAYHLWVTDGHQDGNAEAHWLAAQREILASSLESLGSVSATPPKPKKASSKKKPSKKARAA
jgi:Protein of unknown function (DUF2934)